MKIRIIAMIFITLGIPMSLAAYSNSNSANSDSLPKPMVLVSKNVPAYASSNQQFASYANDGDYNTEWRSSGTISENQPAWLAYDLSQVPLSQRSKVIAVWYNTSTFNYDHTYSNEPAYNSISNYTIEVNRAGGGSIPTLGWKALETIKSNIYHSRQHAVDLTGYNWIRIHATASDGGSGNQDISINFDIHDAGKGYEDSWLFMGDSITAFSMTVNSKGATGLKSFGQMVQEGNKNYFPIQENAGIGGTKTSDALRFYDTWIAQFPGKYVCLSYGTNDVNNNPSGIQSAYNNLETLVNKIIASKKVPVIPHMPWSLAKSVQENGALLNNKIDELYKKYPQIIKGPDLWNVFYNKSHLFSDDLHPNNEGIRVYRTAWADAMLKTLYNVAEIVPTDTKTPSPNKEEYRYNIDSFENYSNDSSLQSVFSRNMNGNQIFVSLSTDNKNEGLSGMKLTYTVGTPSYAGISKKLKNTDMSGCDTLRFWLKPDGSNRTLTIQLKESSGEFWEAYHNLSNTQAEVVEIPISKFKHPGWYKGGNGIFDINSIDEFAIYIGGSSGSSSIYLDNITMIQK